MKTFSEHVRSLAIFMTNGFCGVEGCHKKATEFHHKLANTKVNNRLFPLFIHSLFNCLPICNDCHMSKPKVKIYEKDAIAYEEYLRDYIKNIG